jgi:hypothetical protein
VSTKPANVPAAFLSDHALQLPHHPRVRVGPHYRAQAVVGVLDRRDPVAEGFVDGVLEGPAPGTNRSDLGAEEAHPEHVELLALGVYLAHVHHALEAEQGGRSGAGHPVLAGPRLGDHPGLAHLEGEEPLAQDVVDLVGPRVGEVLTLEQDPDAERLRQPPGLRDRRRPPRVIAQKVVQPGAEGGIGPGRAKGLLQLQARRHERLGNVPPSEPAEAALRAGIGHTHRLAQVSSCQSYKSAAAPSGPWRPWRSCLSISAKPSMAAWMNSRSLIGSL